MSNLNPPGETVVCDVTNQITTFSRPFARLGKFHIGARATAIKLKDNSLFLVSPTILDDKVKEKLGNQKVSYLVAPDVEHYLQLNAYKEVYPDAKLVGPKELQEKGYNLDVVFSEAETEKTFSNGEIKARFFSGFVNKDIAFLHVPSKTLIQADLVCTKE